MLLCFMESCDLSLYAVVCSLMVCHAVVCHDIAMLCKVMLSHDRVMLCCLRLRHVVLCRVRRDALLSCYGMFCNAVP